MDFDGLQWTSMDFNGLWWTAMDWDGLRWTEMDCNRLQQTARDCNGLQLTQTDYNRLQWIQWILMDFKVSDMIIVHKWEKVLPLFWVPPRRYVLVCNAIKLSLDKMIMCIRKEKKKVSPASDYLQLKCKNIMDDRGCLSQDSSFAKRYLMPTLPFIKRDLHVSILQIWAK